MDMALSKFDPLIAATEPVDFSLPGKVVYGFHRLEQFDDPRFLWVGLAAFVLFSIAYTYWFYRREGQALNGFLRWFLPALRIVAVLGAVLFFLDLQKRTDKDVVNDSVVVLLVDVSQSMLVEDESTEEETDKVSRSKRIADALADSPLIAELQKQHDVALAVFDEEVDYIHRWQRNPKNQDEGDEQGKDVPSIDWAGSLLARGKETRLGDAIQAILKTETENPLAGILLFSDGGQNSGLKPMSVAEVAGKNASPILAVGLGSTLPRRNLRVQQMTAPARVYPDDKTMIDGVIRGEGVAGRTVTVELYARDAVANTAPQLIGQKQISFQKDSEDVAVSFEIEPAEIGRLILEMKTSSTEEDPYQADNRREVEMEVVEAKTKVLLLASGAMRDYRFLRNQLRRDQYVEVDIWLQSGLPGISQDADRLLANFPESKEELYPYDCIVAFDPDWGLLDAHQVDLLESWVAEEAGGLVVIAGPVHTSNWIQSPEHLKIRSLYPVEFQKRLTLLDDGLYGSKTPWPIQFSRDGEESNYLWLGDSSLDSREAWAGFSGVYGCYAVKGPKPGARVLGRYSDPDAGISADRPVYFAEHFYGGGRVFYMGSGELWRLRSLDVGYFEILYTSLIRHVSQGRMLRGSSQGQLLLERDQYSVGDEVVVRAQLLNSSREPLLTERVTGFVIGPDGEGINLILQADEDRPGSFLGQFKVRSEGSYRIELPLNDTAESQLAKRIQVVVPDLEFDDTRRNEELLSALSELSGGRYYAELATLFTGDDDIEPVIELLPSRAESKVLRGNPDPNFNQNLNSWLLGIICGALCLEWFLRRLVRLA